MSNSLTLQWSDHRQGRWLANLFWIASALHMVVDWCIAFHPEVLCSIMSFMSLCVGNNSSFDYDSICELKYLSDNFDECNCRLTWWSSLFAWRFWINFWRTCCDGILHFPRPIGSKAPQYPHHLVSWIPGPPSLVHLRVQYFASQWRSEIDIELTKQWRTWMSLISKVSWTTYWRLYLCRGI